MKKVTIKKAWVTWVTPQGPDECWFPRGLAILNVDKVILYTDRRNRRLLELIARKISRRKKRRAKRKT